MSVFALNGHNELVKLNITEETLKISLKTEIGNVEEEINIDLDGEDLEIGFNIKYLIEVLKVINS